MRNFRLGAGKGAGQVVQQLFGSPQSQSLRTWQQPDRSPDLLRGRMQSDHQEETKSSSSRQASQTIRKKIIQYNLISFTHAHPFEVKKTGRGCLNNFLPNENCCGNCSGAICVAPKLWCSGKKGNQARDHRFWQSWADLLLFPLTGLTELETSASECRPTWVWIPAPPPT